MWQKSYRDYKKDEPLVHERVESGRGIIGCEMHELNGWGETWHICPGKSKNRGLIRVILNSLFSYFKKQDKA